MEKLYNLNRIGGGRRDGHRGRCEADSVKRLKETTREDRMRGLLILSESESYWMAMDRFREDRERNKRYAFGDQWSDLVCVDGKIMSEEEYISREGHIPLKNNLIRRLVRTVTGVFRSQEKEPTCIARDRAEQQVAEVMTTVLQYNMQANRMKEIHARSLEEFLISGFVVHRKYYGMRGGREDCWTENVQANNFFIDCNMRDYRGWDCSCVGEIHDIPFNTLCSRFAASQADYQRLADIYAGARDRRMLAQTWEDFGYSRPAGETSFITPRDESLCRIIEVWRKETMPRYRCHDWNSGEIFKIESRDYQAMVVRENEKRLETGRGLGMADDEIPLIDAEWMLDEVWYYYFLTPMGDILAEGETPYEHGEHPYVWKAYPFIDGEIHSFVADIIDQQRYTNRLITLYDWIMRASAKGVLMIPTDCLPKGTNPRDFASTWSKFNGVLMYTPSKSGQVPHQIASNSTNIGIDRLLQIQMGLFEEITGVHGAIQGKSGYSGMSASLYAQQAQNSSQVLLDLLESYSEFIQSSAMKDVKNIQQFYDPDKYLNIVGTDAEGLEFTPDDIRNAEFDLSIIESTSSPVYRAMMNDFLMQIWQAGQIDLGMMLEAGSFPFADKLLQMVQAKEQEMQEAQAAQQQQAAAAAAQGGGMPPEGAGAMAMPPEGAPGAMA